jgi:hypothetical protein
MVLYLRTRLALRDEGNKMFVLLYFRKREAEAGVPLLQ